MADIVMSRFRLRGETVKAWAIRNGHKPDTVYKTIHGARGKQGLGESARIKKGLRRDGFWPEETEDPASMPAG